MSKPPWTRASGSRQGRAAGLPANSIGAAATGWSSIPRRTSPSWSRSSSPRCSSHFRSWHFRTWHFRTTALHDPCYRVFTMVDRSTDIGLGGTAFPSTRWSKLLGSKDGPKRDYRDGLERILLEYWKPVYVFVR